MFCFPHTVPLQNAGCSPRFQLFALLLGVFRLPLVMSSVECSPGSFYDNITKSCVLCPIGSYQMTSGQYQCESCPSGTITATVGSVNGSALCKGG